MRAGTKAAIWFWSLPFATGSAILGYVWFGLAGIGIALLWSGLMMISVFAGGAAHE